MNLKRFKEAEKYLLKAIELQERAYDVNSD